MIKKITAVGFALINLYDDFEPFVQAVSMLINDEEAILEFEQIIGMKWEFADGYRCRRVTMEIEDFD